MEYPDDYHTNLLSRMSFNGRMAAATTKRKASMRLDEGRKSLVNSLEELRALAADTRVGSRQYLVELSRLIQEDSTILAQLTEEDRYHSDLSKESFKIFTASNGACTVVAPPHIRESVLDILQNGDHEE